MNVALILLIIIILVLAVYIVYYIGFTSQSLINLSESNATIANKDITNSSSSSFSYSMWVYVNNWSIGEKQIIKAALNNTTKFSVYLDSNSPILKVNILTTDKTSGSNAVKTISVTNNFPIQRWVYIVVSVEGSVVDCYLDGKLVKSQQLNYLPDMSGIYTISYGTFDAFLTKLQRVPKPTDPQTAWNNYMAGNGFSANYGPNYGFSFVLTKDQNPIAKYEYK